MAVFLIFIGFFLALILFSFFSKKNDTKISTYKHDLEIQEKREKIDELLKENEKFKHELGRITRSKQIEIQLLKEEIENKDEKNRNEVNSLKKEIGSLKEIHKKLIREKETKDILLAEKEKSMPWMAEMIADYTCDVISLNNKRVSHNSRKEIEEVNKSLRAQNKLLHYHNNYLLSLIPKDCDEIIYEDDFDSENDIPDIRYYLTKEQYDSLDDIEKWELAFENYKKNRRSRHNVGRDYEMFVGQMYERAKFNVDYHGIKNGIHDLGIDLIAENADIIYVIQCKNWSNRKTIYEKHLCQLYGTYRVFESKLQIKKKVVPVFITSTILSETAKSFAQELGVLVRENLQLGDYKAIKCNLETHIFHLPFDLSYENIKNCVLVNTVKEAVELGCRHSFKHNLYGN